MKKWRHQEVKRLGQSHTDGGWQGQEVSPGSWALDVYSILPLCSLFGCQVMSDSSWPHGLQHARLPCPPLSPAVCSNSSIELVMPSNHLNFCHPLLLPLIFPSIRVFSNESALHIRWPKYWSFSFGVSLSNGCSGLISFRIDWLDLLAVQRTLKSLLQHHSSKASILWSLGFFMVQLSHPYMTTRKTTALTIQTFVSKVMSLLFNTLSRSVVAFLSRSKCLLLSWQQSPSSDFGAQENKICHYFHLFPFYLPWNNGTRYQDLKFYECWALNQIFHSPLSPSSEAL